MKKIAFYLLGAAFLASGMGSCAKTTNGKITNDWKVVSSETTDSYTASNGSSSIVKTTMTETGYTEVYHSEQNGSSYDAENEGTVNVHEINLKKDGAWTWTKDCTSGGTNQTIIDLSGTWNFIKKTKGEDYKKNERVLFNTLTRKVKNISVQNQQVLSETSETYLTGENTMIYSVTASKSKELTLESESTRTSSSDGNTPNINKVTQKIVLKEK